MITREEVLEQFRKPWQSHEDTGSGWRKAEVEAMADEIVRLRAENTQLGAVTIPLVSDDTWALVGAVRVVCAWERPDDLAHLRAMLDAWDNHLLPEGAL